MLLEDGTHALAIVRKRCNEDGIERFAAVAAFSSYDDAAAAMETLNGRDSFHGSRYDIAPLTPAVENWTQ